MLIVVDGKKKRLLAGRRQRVIVGLGPPILCHLPSASTLTSKIHLASARQTSPSPSPSTRSAHPNQRAPPSSSRRLPRRPIAAFASRSARLNTPRRHHRATHAGKETHARDPSDRASPHATGAQIRDTELLEICVGRRAPDSSARARRARDVMLAVSHSFPPLPSSFYREMDESGTIDPAALNAPRMYPY